MADLLPKIAVADDYRALWGKAEVWGPAVRVVCQRHGLDMADLAPFDNGTHVVWGTLDCVIKIFVPIWKEDAIPERLLLPRMAGKLGVATPEPLFEGEVEGWPYVVMTRLPGAQLCKVWGDLEDRDRMAVIEDIGQMMARLHAMPLEGLDTLALDWDAFKAERRRKCLEDQKNRGADTSLLEALETYLSALGSTDWDGRRVLLSADMTDEHFLLARVGGRWRATGFLDFADAMIGAPIYEFAAPAAFFTRDRPDLLRTLFAAYGTPEAQIDAALGRLVASWVILHRYCHLKELMARSPRGGCETLAQLLDEVGRLEGVR